MFRQHHNFRILVLSFLPLLYFFTACSTRNSAVEDGTTVTSLGGTGLGSSKYQAPQVNTSLTTATNTNLFNTALTANERTNNSQWVNYGNVTPQQQSCYVNGFQTSIWAPAQQTSSNSSASGWSQTSQCLAPSQTGVSQWISPEQFYDLGVTTYANMNDCLDRILAVAPQDNSQAEAAHRLGAMALTRCYMALANQLSQSAPWLPEQSQVFQNQNENLRWLLNLIAGYR